jgi:dTMP kinase
LEKGTIVVCDRYTGSTLAYQGYGRGIDLDLLKSLNDFATDGLEPDLVLFMDLDAAEGLTRKKRKWDSFEREEFIFHQRVREGYLEIAAANTASWVAIDASLPEFQITEVVWNRVRDFLIYGNGPISPATRSS